MENINICNRAARIFCSLIQSMGVGNGVIHFRRAYCFHTAWVSHTDGSVNAVLERYLSISKFVRGGWKENM